MQLRSLALVALGWPLFVTGCAHTSDEARWQPLFNGEDLAGWVQRGGTARFHAADGMIVGTSVPNTGNTFLCTERTFRNFVLELEVLQNPQINSGIQFRSLWFDEPRTYRDGDREINVPARRVHGYQFELDPTPRRWTGGIYEEGRRGWLVPLTGKTEAQAAYKLGEWNRIRIECVGDQLRTFVNDVPCAELVDNWTSEGFIGLQVHGVGNRQEPMEIRWRNLRIKELPATER
jgi:hypothetical protein